MRFVAKGILLLLFSIGAFYLGSMQLNLAIKNQKRPLGAGLSGTMLEMISLGHKALYDDYLLLWLVQNYAELDKEDARKVFHDINLTHPKVEAIYLLMCYILAFDFKDPDACTPIAENGISQIPSSWRIPFTVGFFHMYLLKTYDSKTMTFYTLAASKPDAPLHLRETLAKLKTRLIDPEEWDQTFDLMPLSPEQKAKIRERISDGD